MPKEGRVHSCNGKRPHNTDQSGVMRGRGLIGRRCVQRATIKSPGEKPITDLINDYKIHNYK